MDFQFAINYRPKAWSFSAKFAESYQEDTGNVAKMGHIEMCEVLASH